MLIFPVFIPQEGCPFKCVYCDQQQLDSVRESTLQELEEQIWKFCDRHCSEPKQIAFYGGTFTGLTPEARDKYFNLIKPHLDDKTSIRISTRPDLAGQEELDWCRKFGVRTIELGIQDFNDEVLAASGRGYDGQTAAAACQRVKQAGFELGVQLMPGLPMSSRDSVTRNQETLLKLQPDFLRLYPLIALWGTELWKAWERGDMVLLTLDEAVGLCVEYTELLEFHGIKVIKSGLPALRKNAFYAGPYHPSFGELVRAECLLRKILANCEPCTAVLISAADISLFTGHGGRYLNKLRNGLNSCTLRIVSDPSLSRGEFRFAMDKAAG